MIKKEEEKFPQSLEASIDIDPEIKEMLEAGVHFGHRKTWQNPKMKPYIFGIRNTVSIIDLEKTRESLSGILEYLKKFSDEGKTLLFVDTRPSTREDTRKTAEDLGMPYVVERWSGGTITNWKTISGRIEYLKNLESKTKEEEWEKYTKKERSDMSEEIRKLNMFWGGIKYMDKLPDALFVVDMKKNSLAIKEARKMNIPVIAIADTNADPSLVDYPIPANDDALSSVKYILGRIQGAMSKAKTKKPKAKATSQKLKV